MRKAVALCLLLFASTARAVVDREGTTAADFLNIAVGARAVALGQAFSGLADDATALYWNPAALTRVRRFSAALTHSDYIESSAFDYAACAQSLGRAGVLAVGAHAFSAGEIDRLDATGASAGTLKPGDTALSVGYARTFLGFSIGAGAKLIRSKIIDTAKTTAFDAGLLSPLYGNSMVRTSLTMSNYGKPLRFGQTDEDLPLQFRFGNTYQFTRHWVGSLDLGFPNGDDPSLALGVENDELFKSVGRGIVFAGRAGYNSNSISEVGRWTGLALGFGLTFARGFAIDYGYLPLGTLGPTHHLSLAFNY